MNVLIETPNLGPVRISKNVFEYFRKQRDDGELSKAEGEVTRILQSREIDQLRVPALFASLFSSSDGSTNGMEFWVHKESSTVFTVLPKDGYKVISMGIKRDMEGFISDKN